MKKQSEKFWLFLYRENKVLMKNNTYFKFPNSQQQSFRRTIISGIF